MENRDMNLREFADYMKNNILEALDESYMNASVEIREVEKLNSRYTSLLVRREGEEIVPSIDLNEAFARYVDGDSLTTIMADIVDIIDIAKPDFDVALLNDYENIKDKLFVRLSNEETNRAMLENIPHVKKLDMVLTYHIALSEDLTRNTSVTVNNQLLDHLGINAEQLHTDAVKNSMERNPVTIMSMEDALKETLRKDLIESGMDPEEIENQLENAFPKGRGSGLTVISNTDKLNGAAVLLYPETLDKVAEKLNENFYILPSSIHELLAVPESSGMTSNQLDVMVSEVNRSEVKPEDRLSNHCYHYDAKEKLLEHGKQFEERAKRQKLEKAGAEL